MKRIIVFLLLVLLLCGINSTFVKGLSFEKLFEGCEAEVYLSHAVDDLDCVVVKNGQGAIAFCDIAELKYIKNKHIINGFTVKIRNKSMAYVLEKLNPNYITRRGNCIYGYINNVAKTVFVEGEMVNFQCVNVDNDVLVGFPILLGCY